MTMASLTASLLARKGHAQPSASARDIFAPDSEGKRWQSPIKAKQAAQVGTTRIDPNTRDCSASSKEAEQASPRPVVAPKEARHTRLVQLDEVSALSPKKAEQEKKLSADRVANIRKHKSLRLDQEVDMQLRLLAARKGKSQQALMEKAVKQLLEDETPKGTCICGSSKG
ncbi:MAG: hypothetical protein HWE25_12445 [Alphaproteobacteria bacterium]|nr:hypothetical protein [Alphaproteobacteria bacterium]